MTKLEGTLEGSLPVCVKAQTLAAQMGIKPERLREYAAQVDDPLPIRYMPGMERGGFLIVPELVDWCKRNTHLFMERGDHAKIKKRPV